MSEPGGEVEAFGCPFCGERVEGVVVPAIRRFEWHLDRHMARGDQLLEAG